MEDFEEKTTYRKDYTKLPVGYNRPRWEQARSELPTPLPPQTPYKDNETFQNWRKGVYIPFNLFWQPKEVIRTNPSDTFVIPPIIEDPGKEEAMKNRPRIYMSPAVGIDDVDDPEMRRLLCKHMYTTEWGRAMEETAIVPTKREIPNTTYEHSGDPVKTQLDFMPPLPSSFRNQGIEWEQQQLRACVEPTKQFWLNKDPPVKCGACIDPVEGLVSDQIKSEIQNLIRTDKLRLPHDRSMPGYAGYKPRLSYGVPLSKVAVPVEHPCLTTYQAMTFYSNSPA